MFLFKTITPYPSISNEKDDDDNQNGIPDNHELDSDGDGIPDYLDNDDDNDGITDSEGEYANFCSIHD